MATVWIIEDDALIGQGLHRTLDAEGHVVALAPSLQSARALVGTPDVVLLDLGLPDGDGVELCRQLVADHPGVRVIMLTARATEIDTVVGLDAGAVDYVTKPFRLAELLARVRAQVRHTATRDDAGPLTLTVGELVIDLAARQVWAGGELVELRVKEFDLLVRLARQPGTVVRREDLMADVWDTNWWGSTKTLDVHMAALRRRLGERPGDPSCIATVRGVGYRLTP